MRHIGLAALVSSLLAVPGLRADMGDPGAPVKAGPEFLVNTYTTSEQYAPVVAAAPGGDFVVAWSTYRFPRFGLAVRRFDASGVPRGAEFLVTSPSTDQQYVTDIAVGPRGDFVVTWWDYNMDGDQLGVSARCFDANGLPRGAEFRVNTHTTGWQYSPRLALLPGAGFVVVWSSLDQDGDLMGVFGQRYDASGAPAGAEFRVNAYTSASQRAPRVAATADGQFVVAWTSDGQDGDQGGVFGRRYDGAGNPLGGEFQVNTPSTGRQDVAAVAGGPDGRFVVAWRNGYGPSSDMRMQRFDAAGLPLGAAVVITPPNRFVAPDLAADAVGNFVVAWSAGSYYPDVFGQRVSSSGVPRGAAFQVNSYTTDLQFSNSVASDAVGNLVVVWQSPQDGSGNGIFAQRFGGLRPALLDVDTTGNRMLEPGETVEVRPAWRNVNGAAQSFGGSITAFTGPPGPVYATSDASASYGTVPDGGTGICVDCYGVFISSSSRPSTHWDAALTESITPDAHGQQKQWALHVGGSFTDVPASSGFYRFVEALLHHGVTGGCAATSYCPSQPVTRDQMAVFVMVAKEGAGYAPPFCTTPLFGDVPASSPYCRWIEELARRGVVSGCGGGNYCPGTPVTREQMPVFVLHTLDPELQPPACTTPVFSDVPAISPFCRWIEELARRGVVTGCGGGKYCPTDPVTREQMGVFIAQTFGLTLYGP